MPVAPGLDFETFDSTILNQEPYYSLIPIPYFPISPRAIESSIPLRKLMDSGAQ